MWTTCLQDVWSSGFWSTSQICWFQTSRWRQNLQHLLPLTSLPSLYFEKKNYLQILGVLRCLKKQRAENFLFSGLRVSSSPPSFERWPCSVCYLDIFRWRIPHARPKPAVLKKQRGSYKQLSQCRSVATWPKLCRSVTMDQSARRPEKICWDRRKRMEPIWSGTARPSREPCVCVFREYSVFSSSRFTKQENLRVLLWKPKWYIYAHFWLLFTNAN